MQELIPLPKSSSTAAARGHQALASSLRDTTNPQSAKADAVGAIVEFAVGSSVNQGSIGTLVKLAQRYCQH